MAAEIKIIVQSTAAGGGLTQTIDQLKDLDGGAREAASGFSTLASTAASALGGIAVGAAAGLGAAFVGAAGAGLGFNNAMEQATARINAFTKDGDATAEILEMVKERAAETPFAFEEMAAAAAGLGPSAKSAGIPLEQLIEKAEILAASNPAEGLEGGVVAIKEALSGDFTSAIERFNLSRQYINDLRAQGVPDLEALSMAMTQAGYDTDLVSNLANTAQGRWSTFMDTWTTLAGTVTQPIFDTVSAGLGGANAKLTEMMPQLLGVAQGMADFISAVISSDNPLATLGTKVQELAGNLVAWVQESIPGWVAGLGEMGRALVAWVGENLPGMLTALLDARNALVQWVLDSLPGWASQLATLGAGLLQWVIDALPGLGQNLGQITALLIEKTAEFIAETAPKLAELGVKFITWIATEVLPTLPSKLAEIAAALVSGIGAFIAEVGPPLVEVAQQFLAWVADEVLPTLPGKLAEIGSAIVQGISDFIGSVGAEAGKVADSVIDGMVQGIQNGVAAVISAAKQMAQDALDAAMDIIKPGSPSKVFTALGLTIPAGLVQGIDIGAPAVAAASAGMAGGAVSTATTTVNRAFTFAPTYNSAPSQVMDAQTARAMAGV